MNNKKKLFGPGKGNFGYFAAEKKRLFLWTAILYAVPLAAFFGAWAYNGTQKNIITVVAIVGMIPACKFAVSLIMALRQKGVPQELYQQISSRQKDLVMAYELYMTFYEKSASIAAFAVCGNQVIGYSIDPKIDTSYMEEHAADIIHENGYRKVTVKIFKDLKPFLERLDSMNEHRASLCEGIRFKEDDRYPGFTREEVIRAILLAICI